MSAPVVLSPDEPLIQALELRDPARFAAFEAWTRSVYLAGYRDATQRRPSRPPVGFDPSRIAKETTP